MSSISNFQINNVAGCHRTTPTTQDSNQTGPKFTQFMEFLTRGERGTNKGQAPARVYTLGLNQQGLDLRPTEVDTFDRGYMSGDPRPIMCFKNAVQSEPSPPSEATGLP